MANIPYYEQKDIENIKKLREMMKELPPFCTEFFRGIEPRTSTRTRIAYAYDLSVFFDFLKKENPVFAKMERMDFKLGHLDQITVTDLEEYMEYLKYRFNDHNQEVINKERGIMRKISFTTISSGRKSWQRILLPLSSFQSSTRKRSSALMSMR